MASVVSGLGRTGPWLQNDWLRVETRLDDASIAPVALPNAFRPVERGIAYVRCDDGSRLEPMRADYDVRPHADALGAGRCLVLTSRLARQGVTLRREIILYDAHPFCVTRIAISNDGVRERCVESLHPFATTTTQRGKLKFSSSSDAWRVYRHGWQSWSPTMSLAGTQRDLQSRGPELAPEPPLTESGSFASEDVAVLYDPAVARSLLVGAISARAQLSRIFIDVPSRSIDAVCVADGAALRPGETLWSERVLVDVCGSPNDQLERYGDALGREMGARVPARPPSGWCSWYYFFTQVTEDDVLRNLRFLEAHRRDLPVDTVQIDDGYQADIGDWLTVNDKFPHGMQWLAAEIKRAGFTPGIWLAPFLLSESSRTFADHPDWIIRAPDGDAVVACENWQRKSYGIDGSHPGARDWLTSLFREVCDGWGYDYVKIDFLYAAALSGGRHDPDATRIKAYRDALTAVRDGVGNERFILGCGALMAPSVGMFDGNRIGPDVAPFWRFLTTEERAVPRPRFRRPDDPLSAETAIRSTLNRSWMQGRLWANDPDCMLVRTDRTKLTLDETRTLATAIGLSGGMVLSSDNLGNVPDDRLDILRMLLPALPAAARPNDLMLHDMPERFESTFARDHDAVTLVGVFNFDDDAVDVEVPLADGRWHAFELWSSRYLGVLGDAITFTVMEPHGCRLLVLRRDVGHPQLVATDAHVGAGVIDITDVRYDAGSRTLTLRLVPHGRRSRRIFVATGALTPISVRCDGLDVAWRMVADAVCEISVEIESEADLVAIFN